jgi:uncharacterized protein (TIGR00369 family)
MPEPTNVDDFTEQMNASRDGWCTAMDMRFVRVTLDEVVAELVIGDRHKQAYGIVHGGVHCGLIETLASVGAALNALKDGRSAVGLENHTSFLSAVREGKLIARAVPVTRGKRSQVWEATVATEAGKLVAKGSVRVICLEVPV